MVGHHRATLRQAEPNGDWVTPSQCSPAGFICQLLTSKCLQIDSCCS